MALRFLRALSWVGALAWGSIQAAYAVPLVLGSVSDTPGDDLKAWLPFVRYLASELAGDGVTEGRIAITRTSEEMSARLNAGAARFKAGSVDLYMDSPLIMLSVVNSSGAKLMARRWKGGIAEYTSVVFTRKDSGITTLADLKNKIIAFEDGSSSSGYLLPWLALQRVGLMGVQMSNHTMAPPDGQVGYMFSGDTRNTVAWVLYDRVMAGAIPNSDFNMLKEEQRAQLAIIYESVLIPRHVVAYRADLAPTLAMRIKEILVSMDKTEAGRKVLATFENTQKFDDIPPDSMALLKIFDEELRKSRPTQ